MSPIVGPSFLTNHVKIFPVPSFPLALQNCSYQSSSDMLVDMIPTKVARYNEDVSGAHHQCSLKVPVLSRPFIKGTSSPAAYIQVFIVTTCTKGVIS